MDILFQMEAVAKINDKLEQISIVISSPQKNKDADDYFCTIYIPFFFGKEKYIYGTNQKQTAILSKKFLNNVLYNINLIDKDGKSINLKKELGLD